MSDAELFQEVAAEHGGRAGEAGPRMRANLRSKGVTEPAVEHLAGYLLGRPAEVRAVTFFTRRELLDASPQDWRPNVREDGLLVVGSCPNGDYVAVDVRDALGAAGYFSHETGWQGRQGFVVVAPGLGALAAGLAAGRLPVDYHEAATAAARGGEPNAAADRGGTPGSPDVSPPADAGS